MGEGASQARKSEARKQGRLLASAAKAGSTAQPKASIASPPLSAPKDANWGFQSSERQKDKARSTGAPVKSAAEELARRNPAA